MITVRLDGPLQILGEDRQDLTPRGAKTQALVALLMTAAGYSRARGWLQGKLWSDRGQSQAAGSLRQSLYELRECLGEARIVLRSDRKSVSLNPALVRLLPSPVPGGQEFLEGIDVGDPEFEDWLSLQRSAREAEMPAPPMVHRAAEPVSVLLRLRDGVPEEDLLGVRMIVDAFAQALDERALVDVHRAEVDRPSVTTHLAMEFELHSDARLLRAQMTEAATGRHIWAKTLRLHSGPKPDARWTEYLARYVSAGVEAVIGAALRQKFLTANRDLAIHRAVQSIFAFQERDLLAADRLLADAGEENPAALGWRVFLRMVQHVEHAATPEPTYLEEVDELVRTALQRAPMNSVVLSAASHACIKVLDRPEDALVLAERALRQSWSNPFALDVLADALLLRNRVEEAYELSRKAQFIGQQTQMSHFFDMGLCLASVATGRTDEALTLARQAAALSPSFRPALRYAAVLNAVEGRMDEANRAMSRLRAVEPDFDPARLLGDPDYPVATFRASRFVQAGGVQELF